MEGEEQPDAEYGGEAQHDMPDWVPDEYDPDAPLSERLPVIAEMEGGIEVHVRDGSKGTVEVVHEPQHFYENPRRVKMCCGVRADDWNWEIIVPKGDAGPVLKHVDPNQDIEAYQATQKTWLKDIDVRVYGVDRDRWEQEVTA